MRKELLTMQCLFSDEQEKVEGIHFICVQYNRQPHDRHHICFIFHPNACDIYPEIHGVRD